MADKFGLYTEVRGGREYLCLILYSCWEYEAAAAFVCGLDYARYEGHQWQLRRDAADERFLAVGFPLGTDSPVDGWTVPEWAILDEVVQ